jgi:hypothetical protein
MYVGTTPGQLGNELDYRYFYGLRRTDEGTLFLGKLDHLSNSDSLTINQPGLEEDNFTNFSEGQDFFEGRDIQHDLVFKNLEYEQFLWDNKNVYYYINSNGELIISINVKPSYDEDSSSTQSYSETQNYLPAGYVQQGYVTNS